MPTATSSVLDFKSATLYAVRLVLRSSDTTALLAALHQRLDAAPGFFDGEPVVIDATLLERAPDWQQLAQALQQRGLPLVGVTAAEAWQDDIRAAGLAAVELASAREAAAQPAPAASLQRDPPAAPASSAAVQVLAEAGVAQDTAEAPVLGTVPVADPAHRPTLILDQPLRSGQRAYARGADLIIVGMVSPGAEVMADGSIHVYGPLRGKAMAGVRGDETARIFTTHLDAQLVSVAGVYRVIDTPLPDEVRQRLATVRLKAGVLGIEPLAT